jgi:AcrR family transcriptional regulator
MSESASVRRGRGRPVDPEIESRVTDAAVRIYAEVGWAGFTFDAIASRAGVGKAALYRRWPVKREILRAALRAANVGFVEVPDTGDIRGDLVTLAKTLLDRLDQPVGLAEIRLMLDAKVFPEDFDEDLDYSRASSRGLAREGIDRAISRGELPRGTRPETVFDLVRGAIIHTFLMVPGNKQEAWLARRARLPEEIVDVVLAGLRAHAEPPADID